MRKITTRKSVLARGTSAKPASAPKLVRTAAPLPVKTAYPIGPLQTSPTESTPEVTAAMTTANARNRLVGAVRHGHQLWRVQASFKNLRINAVSATGMPGCLDGPELGNLIDSYPDIQSLTGLEVELYEAVRDGVAECFDEWRRNVTVPGLPWYPSFAAFPGPVAPPTPNVPMPLVSCVSSRVDRIMAPGLKESMVAHLRDEIRTSEVLGMIDQISFELGTQFLVWLPSQLVMNVLGKGPIPTFAPPYVPVGPVVMGDNIQSPGHLGA